MSQAPSLKLNYEGAVEEPVASRRGEPQFDPRPLALRVEWRKSVSEIAPELFERCFPSPLEGRWLYATLEQSGLEAQFSFAYALVLRGDAIIAIAPTFTAILPISLIVPDIVDKTFRLGGRLLEPLRFQKTMFVGSPCSDEGSIGTVPGVTLADVALTLQRALWQRTRECGAASLVWKDFPQAHWPALRAVAREAKLGEAVSYPGTRISNIEGGFDAYLQRLTGNRRHNLRKKLRQSRSHIDLETEILSPLDGSRIDDALIEEVWGLFRNTYERATTKFEHLTRRFWELVSREPQSRLIVLRRRADGEAVAFMLVILQGERAINKFIGIDYSLGSKAYLYFRLWEEFMRFAMSSGASEVQSGQTGYRAKLDVGHELVPLSNFFRYRNPLIQIIATLVAKRISWNSLDDNLELAAKSRGWRKAGGTQG